MKPIRHGTPSGYLAHSHGRNDHCQPCIDAWAKWKEQARTAQHIPPLGDESDPDPVNGR